MRFDNEHVGASLIVRTKDLMNIYSSPARHNVRCWDALGML